MKKLLMAFSLTICAELLFAQSEVIQLDTIYASTRRTTALKFPNDVTSFDIGSEDFAGEKSLNLLKLKAATETAAPTSLLIQYGNELYHGTIAFKEPPPSLFIDFGKINSKNIPTAPNPKRISKDDSIKTLDSKIAEKRLNHLLSQPDGKYKTIVARNEKIVLTLFNMMTDDEKLYLKLLFINDSKIEYQIDFAEFVYRDPIESSDLKGQYERKNVDVIYTNNIEQVMGKEQSYLGYVIPRYALTKKGELLIIIREKRGSRSVQLTIPFKIILEANPIK